MKVINLDSLVNLRKKSHLTQAELARKVGVDRSMINNIEAGRVSPGLLVTIKIANALGCKVDDLIFFNKNVYPEGTSGEEHVKYSNR